MEASMRLTRNVTRFGSAAAVALLAASVMLPAAASAQSPDATSAPPPEVSAAPSAEMSALPAPVPAASGQTGSITISGSSTVQPISTAVQELFNATNPGVAITVDGPGTGDGFKLFCNGETDISDASRAIKPTGEADLCAQN